MPRYSGPLARPTVKRIELTPDTAQIVRNACIARYGTASKLEVTEYVNDLIKEALAARRAAVAADATRGPGRPPRMTEEG